LAGIYIHIPFCRKRCTYCDFHFSTRFSKYRTELLNAIEQELFLRKGEVNEAIETIYFGGGTPSILTKEELTSILHLIHKEYQLAEDLEVTLEANPEDIFLENIESWREIGINRLSIGIQSLDDEDLAWMNRGHHVHQSLNVVELAAKAGIKNISIDLIYGLPNLSTEKWKNWLESIIELPITHLSAYSLTVENKTALSHQVKRKTVQMPEDETMFEQYQVLVDVLKKNGFEQYEVSNFAREKNYSKHNSSYWQGKKYIGVGPSAHSFNSEIRRWNVANNSVYYKSVGKNETWFESEVLGKNEQWNELFLIGLRTKWGVKKSTIEHFGGFLEKEKIALTKLLDNDAISEDENCYRLNAEQLFKADGVALQFFRVT
jgi:oxygen-independent coproporphyrinogen III oxidase